MRFVFVVAFSGSFALLGAPARLADAQVGDTLNNGSYCSIVIAADGRYVYTRHYLTLGEKRKLKRTIEEMRAQLTASGLKERDRRRIRARLIVLTESLEQGHIDNQLSLANMSLEVGFLASVLEDLVVPRLRWEDHRRDISQIQAETTRVDLKTFSPVAHYGVLFTSAKALLEDWRVELAEIKIPYVIDLSQHRIVFSSAIRDPALIVEAFSHAHFLYRTTLSSKHDTLTPEFVNWVFAAFSRLPNSQELFADLMIQRGISPSQAQLGFESQSPQLRTIITNDIALQAHLIFLERSVLEDTRAFTIETLKQPWIESDVPFVQRLQINYAVNEDVIAALAEVPIFPR